MAPSQAKCTIDDGDRLITIVENTSDLVAIGQLDKTLSYLNSAGRKLLGFGPDDVIEGKLMSDCHSEEDFEFLQSVALPYAIEHGVWRGKNHILDTSGTDIPVSQVVMAHKNDAGELLYFSTIMRDIREEIEAEQEREEFVRQLKASNLDLQQFNYAVSHDLKSPLITINGFLWKLQKDAKEGNQDKITRDIEVISDSVTKVHSLLDDMLNYSKLSEKFGELSDVSLPEIKDVVIDMMRGEYGELCDRIHTNADLPTVRGHRCALTEVLLNLLSNAIKYRSPGEELRIEVGSVPDENNHVIYVKDNGIGIEPDYKEKIFRIFERLNADSSGNGVGLSIAKSIITKHGGSLWVESEGENRGSTFFLSLPI